MGGEKGKSGMREKRGNKGRETMNKEKGRDDVPLLVILKFRASTNILRSLS